MDTQERIEALERKCNRMRASQMALVGVLAAVFLVGAAQRDSDKVLRAGKLEIVNDQGVVIASLEENFVGDGMFSLFMKTGKKFLRALAEDTGGTVATYDGKGQKLVRLEVTTDGEGAVATYDRAGNPEYVWPRRP